MAQGDRPIGRLKYKGRDGVRYDIGTVWPGGSVSPVKVNEPDAQYPKMCLSEAARKAENGEGFLDLFMADGTTRGGSQGGGGQGQRSQQQRGGRQREPRPDEWDDSDPPF